MGRRQSPAGRTLGPVPVPEPPAPAPALDAVPEAHRATVRHALAAAFPDGGVEAVEPGPSGASGATTFRLRGGGAGDHLLRLEGHRIPDRNPHQYANLVQAAQAGIAPPVRFVDEAAGVLIVAWIDTRPLAEFPGGPIALAAAAGTLVARLQAGAPFPATDDWAQRVGRLLAYVRAAGIVAPGLLDEIAAAYDRVLAAWPRDPSTFVPAHNDPNLSNLLYDGERLWLVDWETSGPNDPLVDLAVVANQLATTDEVRDALLTAWAGGTPPTPVLRARLALAQFATALFAGCAVALIARGVGAAPLADLDAPTPEVFEQEVRAGHWTIGAPDTMAAFAKVVLATLRDRIGQPDFVASLATAVSPPA
jgi:hypothetical protein